MMKISKQIIGVAGEYYVAAELSRRGLLAAITLRNSDGVDILVGNSEGEQLFSVQVKTTQGKKKWPLSKKVEAEKSEKKIYAFVSIPARSSDPPLYYFVRASVLAKSISEGHARWLKEPGKGGQKRNDSDMRQFDPRYFSEEELIKDWEALIESVA